MLVKQCHKPPWLGMAKRLPIKMVMTCYRADSDPICWGYNVHLTNQCDVNLFVPKQSWGDCQQSYSRLYLIPLAYLKRGSQKWIEPVSNQIERERDYVNQSLRLGRYFAPPYSCREGICSECSLYLGWSYRNWIWFWGRVCMGAVTANTFSILSW